MTEEKQPVSLDTSITAKFSGIFRGNDPSLVFLGLFALLGVIVCTTLTVWTPWGGLGVAAFLLFFLFILLNWKRAGNARSNLDVPATTLNLRTGEDEIAVSFPSVHSVENARNLLTQMREVMLSRQLPPAPTGEVVGPSSDQKSLRIYSPEEQQKILDRWTREIPEHDRRVVDELTSSMKAPEGRSEGLRQASSEQVQQLEPSTSSTISTPDEKPTLQHDSTRPNQ